MAQLIKVVYKLGPTEGSNSVLEMDMDDYDLLYWKVTNRSCKILYDG